MRLIGRYEVLGLLGRGGMGAVYKVRAPVTGRVAALKILAPDETVLALWGRERLEARFMAEAALLGSLRHRNLVDVRDVDRHGDRPFFVMDYHCDSLGQVIGETYRVEAPTRRLSVGRAGDYAGQLLSGLARLRQAGIVHRDIKPFNLLITDEDTLKITDFGLSRVRGERFDGPKGLAVGSPYYAAPEQEADPDRADARSDLFAAGVTLFRMLTGRLPQETNRPPSALNPDLDPDWDAFLAKAASRRPEDRFQEAGEMLARLEALLSAFATRLAGTCALAGEEAPARTAPATIPGPRRAAPLKVPAARAREVFGLDGLWRPVRYACAELMPRDDGTVFDSCSGLLWTTRTAPYPLTFEEAGEHALALGRAGFAGRRGWRLPTVDELAGILRPTPLGTGHCLDPVFVQPVRRVWSADRASFMAAWMADVEFGYVTRGDFTCRIGARAVCGP